MSDLESDEGERNIKAIKDFLKFLRTFANFNILTSLGDPDFKITECELTWDFCSALEDSVDILYEKYPEFFNGKLYSIAVAYPEHSLSSEENEAEAYLAPESEEGYYTSIPDAADDADDAENAQSNSSNHQSRWEPELKPGQIAESEAEAAVQEAAILCLFEYMKCRLLAIFGIGLTEQRESFRDINLRLFERWHGIYKMCPSYFENFRCPPALIELFETVMGSLYFFTGSDREASAEIPHLSNLLKDN